MIRTPYAIDNKTRGAEPAGGGMKQTAAVYRALARVAAGETAYAAAKAEEIALSTIYRALKRQKAAKPARKVRK